MNRLTCPFDPAHVVEGRKFQAHLIKCKRNLPANHDFVQCDFWHLHYVRKNQLDSHLANCEHRLEKEAFKITWKSETPKFFQPKLLPVEDRGPSAIEDQESWESTSGPAFKPEKMIAGAIHMTIPQGLSKSKRKEFREQELERLRQRREREGDVTAKTKENESGTVSHFVQQTRKPEAPLKLHRIVAKFPVPIDNAENLPYQSINTHVFASERQGPDDVARGWTSGRGRGILGPTEPGWSHLE